jgi:hypothetical protein
LVIITVEGQDVAAAASLLKLTLVFPGGTAIHDGKHGWNRVNRWMVFAPTEW